MIRSNLLSAFVNKRYKEPLIALLAVVGLCILGVVIDIVLYETRDSCEEIDQLQGRHVSNNMPDLAIRDMLNTVTAIANDIDDSCYLSSAILEGRISREDLSLELARFVFAKPTSVSVARQFLHPSFEWIQFIIICVDLHNGEIIQGQMMIHGGQPTGSRVDDAPFLTQPYAAFVPENITITDLERALFEKINYPKTLFGNLPVEVYLPIISDASAPSYFVLLKHPLLEDFVYQEQSIPIPLKSDKQEDLEMLRLDGTCLHERQD